MSALAASKPAAFPGAILAVLGLVSLAAAQTPVPVGQGSYAAFPPPGAMLDASRKIDLVEQVESRKLYRVTDDRKPIPSNKWFQNLLFQPLGTGLWAMPHKIDATREGFELFYPTSFSEDGTRSLAEFPLVFGGKNFQPVDSRVKSWSDWMVSFRLPQGDDSHVDVTLGEGMPFVWAEYHRVEPRIGLGGRGGRGSRGRNPARFFDRSGQPIQLPFTGDTLGISHEGRSYAVFAPDGTRFEAEGLGVAVRFTGAASYLVACPLPAVTDIALFHAHAFAIPRETRLSWNYDREAGTLSTTWTIAAEPLKGSSPAVLQGWLPHHWRDVATDVRFLEPSYRTIRGKLRLASGNRFTFLYPFHGVLPNLPAPSPGSGFDRERLRASLARNFAARPAPHGGDTYAAGKSLQQFAQAAFIARQIGDPSAEAILGKLRADLENWFTYTPGEKAKFFAYYPRRKGLVGFRPAFGSEHFTDHHFHYGYFATAAALLASLQPDFAAGYGEMAKLITREYANPDRDDLRFPFFRAWDVWRGHSFADGNGFPEGNNQESTGEALNSWVGMIFLGEVLGDPDLTAAGVMGFTFESRACLEYWFDPHGDIFPPNYPHKACGMIWSSSIVWGTWFTASPAWIYGIQWLPSGPWLAFYDRDSQWMARLHADLFREQEAFESREAAKKPGSRKKPADLKAQGGELASYILGLRMHADPAGVCDQLDALGKEPGDTIARNEWMAAVDYQAHALKSLGRVDWSVRANCPTALAYRHPETKIRTFVAWNPTSKPRTVIFHAEGQRLGTLAVPPRQITQAQSLQP